MNVVGVLKPRMAVCGGWGCSCQDMTVAGVDMARAMTEAEVGCAGMWLWGMDKASDIKVAGGLGTLIWRWLG